MDPRIMHVQIITLDEVKIYQLKPILLEMTKDHLCLFPSLFLKYISLEPDIISLKKPDVATQFWVILQKYPKITKK